jgi:excisionase family DNA binding protein
MMEAMTAMLDGKFVTVSEAAKELGLSRQRVHKLIQSGQMASEVVHARMRVIPRKSLDALKKIDRPHGVHVDKRQRHPRRAG